MDDESTLDTYCARYKLFTDKYTCMPAVDKEPIADDSSSQSEDSSREVEGKMEPDDEATADDECGQGSTKRMSDKGKGKAKDTDKGQGKQAQGGAALRCLPRLMRTAKENRKIVIDSNPSDSDDYN